MKLAAAAITSGELSIREASAVYGIPKSTLERHKNKKVQVPGCLGRFQPTFDVDIEKELVSYCVDMQHRLFGLSLTDLRQLAFKLAERNGLSHKFNEDKQVAGKDWVHGFLRRNPQICLRAPEPTSIGRAVGCNSVQVGRFYDLVEETYRMHPSIQPCHVWNVDETGLVTVHKPSKVLAPTGQKQVGKITTGEKGRTITAVCAFNAVGTYVAPMMVFPRVYFNDRLLHGAPPQTVGVASKSGWIDQGLFRKWLEHFIHTVKPSTGDPHILFLDGHVSHKSLEVIDLARKNGITLICFPPHTTHVLQPLDRVFYGPLKTHYNRACESFMLHNPGRRIDDYKVAGLFNTAYMAAATMDKGVSGFECTGIFPLNRDRIPEYRFTPSLTTDNTTDEPSSLSDSTLSAPPATSSAADSNESNREHSHSSQSVRTVHIVEGAAFKPPAVGEELLVIIHSGPGQTGHLFLNCIDISSHRVVKRVFLLSCYSLEWYY